MAPDWRYDVFPSLIILILSIACLSNNFSFVVARVSFDMFLICAIDYYSNCFIINYFRCIMASINSNQCLFVSGLLIAALGFFGALYGGLLITVLFFASEFTWFNFFFLGFLLIICLSYAIFCIWLIMGIMNVS